jgi:maleamate amidohydrolase
MVTNARQHEVAQDYQRAGFNRRLGMGARPAVLIVDMCRAYFSAGSPLDLGDDAAVVGCETLVDTARHAGIPVLWSRVEFVPGGADGGVFYRKVGALSVFDRGNELGDWLDVLRPQLDEPVFTKQGASSFFGTGLAEHLRAEGVDTLIIGGVSTSGCVRASALDACQENFVPIVVPEACGDRDPVIHHNSLFDLDAKYADVEPLASVLAAITE